MIYVMCSLYPKFKKKRKLGPNIFFGEGNGNLLQYLCLEIPWTEEPGRLQSMGSRRVRHDWVTSLSLFTFTPLEKEMATHSSVLAWRIPGTGEPDGLPSMGSHRVRHDWSDLAVAAAGYWLKLVERAPAKSFGTCGRDSWLLTQFPFPSLSLVT